MCCEENEGYTFDCCRYDAVKRECRDSPAAQGSSGVTSDRVLVPSSWRLDWFRAAAVLTETQLKNPTLSTAPSSRSCPLFSSF